MAVSTNAAKVAEFGIDTDNMFGFWDWVGGRYSFESAIGFSLMIAIGPSVHRHAGGFHVIDEHFRTAPFEANLPVLLGLIGVWYINFFGAETQAILPYNHYLSSLPPQQLDMESNRKTSPSRASPSTEDRPGRVGHARHQRPARLLPAPPPGNPPDPRGLHRVPRPEPPGGTHHDLLMANFFAQSEALAFGRTSDQAEAEAVPPLVPHRTFAGNRPTNTSSPPS